MPESRVARRWRWPLTLLLAAATFAGALAGCENLDTQQRKWIFQASVLPDTDDGAHLDGIDDVWIDVPGPAPIGRLNDVAGIGRLHGTTPIGRLHGVASIGRLHGLWIANPHRHAPVLLFLHGSRRDVEDSEFRMRHMRDLGFSVLAIDYRGFGRSSDLLPSEASVDADARAAWTWLASRYPKRDRYIFGHSLGGAIGVRLASEVDDAKGLIVEGTFPSIAAVVATFKWGWLPFSPLITQRFDSADRIAEVEVPVLVVHGTRDTLIPPALGRELFDRAHEPKRFVLVEGGTHYSTNGRGQRQYETALHDLFGIGG